MTINTTAIKRGAVLAKQSIADQSKQASSAGMVKVQKPNRAQRRAAKKQERRK